MVNAIVLLKVKSDKINQVAEELAALDGISEVYSVAGQYDLVAIIRARDDDQIATLVEDLVGAVAVDLDRIFQRIPDDIFRSIISISGLPNPTRAGFRV